MAKKTASDALDATPDTVQLRCEDLGKTRDFTPAHAQALQELQQSRSITGDTAWLPVATPAAD